MSVSSFIVDGLRLPYESQSNGLWDCALGDDLCRSTFAQEGGCYVQGSCRYSGHRQRHRREDKFGEHCADSYFLNWNKDTAQ